MNLLQFKIHPILTLIGAIGIGAISALYAKKRGKDPYLWFLLGAIFGLIGLFFLFFSPKSKAPATGQKGAKAQVPETPSEKPVQGQLFWYYLDEQRAERGPFSFDVLKKAWHDGRLSTESYVWNPTLDKWQRLGAFM
jgi:hypothetical protein